MVAERDRRKAPGNRTRLTGRLIRIPPRHPGGPHRCRCAGGRLLPLTIACMPEPGEVKAARNRAGMTQQQLADLLGVHVKTLRDYEKGKRARLRAGQAKLSDFIAAHPEPVKVVPQPLIEQRALAEATDMELIAALTARLAELRRALDMAQVLPVPDPPAPGTAPETAAPDSQTPPEPSASSDEEPAGSREGAESQGKGDPA